MLVSFFDCMLCVGVYAVTAMAAGQTPNPLIRFRGDNSISCTRQTVALKMVGTKMRYSNLELVGDIFPTITSPSLLLSLLLLV